MTTFGTTAPGPKVYEHFGITADAIATKAAALIDYFSNRAIPPKVESFGF